MRKVRIACYSFNTIDRETIDMTQTAENNMLRKELELLMKERETLLIITGVAAGLIAEIRMSDLPIRTVEAADLLATSINQLPEETLQDALNAVHASIAL
jgi:hypothetical protein